MKRRILVVDDMAFNRDHLRKVLEIEGYEVETAADGRSALECLRERIFHLVITDLRMPDMSGLELLVAAPGRAAPGRRDRADRPTATPHDALEAMKAGADDFLTKPYDPDHLRFLVQRILERRRLIDELEQLRKQLQDDYSFHNMVSKSPKMRTDLRPDRAGRPARLDGPDPRRDRHRQGTGRPGDPRGRQPPRTARSSP